MADDISFTETATLVPSFSNPGNVRVVRVGSKSGPVREWGPHDVRIVPVTCKWVDAHVYTVTLSRERLSRWSKQHSPYILVATSRGSAQSYLEKRYRKIAERQKGLAVACVGECLAKISTRPPSSGNIGRRAHVTAKRNASVVERVGDSSYTLSVNDNVSYAELAVKGGRRGVDDAMKRAANKIAGLIQHKCKNLLFEGEITTPFPEVRRNRRTR